jgi:hypothetical protein
MNEVVDIAPYRKDAEVQEAEVQLRSVADDARELVIVDDASNAVALDLLSRVTKAGKRIDALKKRWLDPLNAQVKLIREDFTNMAAPAKEAEGILRQKTGAYRAQVAEEQRKAIEAARKEEERLRKLAEARQERAEERAAAQGIEPPQPAPFVPVIAPPAPLAKSVETDNGAKVTYRKQIHYAVVDSDAVPREYLCVDEKKLGAAARAGIITPENCPAGVRVWVTEEPVVR